MKTIIFLIMFLFTQMTLANSLLPLSNADKVQYVFNHLSKDSLYLIDEFYNTEVEFIDPVGTIKGSEDIKKYYQGLYQNVEAINFTFHQIIEQNQTIVATWTMHLKTQKLNSGEPFSVEGNSVITFNKENKVIYHRDYFDMGAFIYERIPVLRYVIRKIRKNLSHK